MSRLLWMLFSVLMLIFNAYAGFDAHADGSYWWAGFYATFFVLWVMILWKEIQES